MKDPLIEEMLNKADERIESAQVLYENDHFGDSISRSYYAMLDAARTALVLVKVYPKSHSGTVHKFNEYFIKTGKIAKTFSSVLSQVEKSREEADYEFEKRFTKNNAKEALKQAKKFVTVIKQFVRDYESN